MRQIGNNEAATELDQEARKLYQEIVWPSHTKIAFRPRDEDYERIVPLWSR